MNWNIQSVGNINIYEVVCCPVIHQCPLRLPWNTEADLDFKVQGVLTMPGPCLSEE